MTNAERYRYAQIDTNYTIVELENSGVVQPRVSWANVEAERAAASALIAELEAEIVRQKSILSGVEGLEETNERGYEKTINDLRSQLSATAEEARRLREALLNIRSVVANYGQDAFAKCPDGTTEPDTYVGRLVNKALSLTPTAAAEIALAKERCVEAANEVDLECGYGNPDRCQVDARYDKRCAQCRLFTALSTLESLRRKG